MIGAEPEPEPDHGALAFGPGLTDPLSTAPTFDGWAEVPATWGETEPWTPPPRTWLLGRGWLRAGGRISTFEVPGRSPNAPPRTYWPARV